MKNVENENQKFCNRITLDVNVFNPTKSRGGGGGRASCWGYLWPLEPRQINRDGRRVASNNERQNRNGSCEESVKSFEFCDRPPLQKSLFLCPFVSRSRRTSRRAWREIRTDTLSFLSSFLPRTKWSRNLYPYIETVWNRSRETRDIPILTTRSQARYAWIFNRYIETYVWFIHH